MIIKYYSYSGMEHKPADVPLLPYNTPQMSHTYTTHTVEP